MAAVSNELMSLSTTAHLAQWSTYTPRAQPVVMAVADGRRWPLGITARAWDDTGVAARESVVSPGISRDMATTLFASHCA